MFISLVMSYNIKIKLNIYFIKYLTHIIILFFLEYICIYKFERGISYFYDFVFLLLLYKYGKFVYLEIY